MTEGAGPLGRAMSRRQDVLGVSWRQIALDGGVSYETLRKTKKGKQRRLPATTRRGLERGFQWPGGMVDRILSGEVDVETAAHYGMPQPGSGGAEDSPELGVVQGEIPVELRDETERQLWAMPGLTEAQKWMFIRLYRADQQSPEQSSQAR